MRFQNIPFHRGLSCKLKLDVNIVEGIASFLINIYLSIGDQVFEDELKDLFISDFWFSGDSMKAKSI